MTRFFFSLCLSAARARARAPQAPAKTAHTRAPSRAATPARRRADVFARPRVMGEGEGAPPLNLPANPAAAACAVSGARRASLRVLPSFCGAAQPRAAGRCGPRDHARGGVCSTVSISRLASAFPLRSRDLAWRLPWCLACTGARGVSRAWPCCLSERVSCTACGSAVAATCWTAARRGGRAARARRNSPRRGGVASALTLSVSAGEWARGGRGAAPGGETAAS